MNIVFAEAEPIFTVSRTMELEGNRRSGSSHSSFSSWQGDLGQVTSLKGSGFLVYKTGSLFEVLYL